MCAQLCSTPCTARICRVTPRASRPIASPCPRPRSSRLPSIACTTISVAGLLSLLGALLRCRTLLLLCLLLAAAPCLRASHHWRRTLHSRVPPPSPRAIRVHPPCSSSRCLHLPCAQHGSLPPSVCRARRVASPLHSSAATITRMPHAALAASLIARATRSSSACFATAIPSCCS